MKITKGELKKIIAEEHARVYGSPAQRRANQRQLIKEQKRAHRRQELLWEAKDLAFAEEVLEEGLWGAIKGFFGGEGGVGASVQSAYQGAKATVGRWKKAANDASWAEEVARDLAPNVAENMVGELINDVFAAYKQANEKAIKKMAKQYRGNMSQGEFEQGDPQTRAAAFAAVIVPAIWSSAVEKEGKMEGLGELKSSLTATLKQQVDASHQAKQDDDAGTNDAMDIMSQMQMPPDANPA